MPSHELPLDIPYAKLAEWLVRKYICDIVTLTPVIHDCLAAKVG